jgi:phenylacetate-coenzyme A ligase PaaK-like adenylate-forming protein
VSPELSNLAFKGIHFFIYQYKQNLLNQVNVKVKRNEVTPDIKIAIEIINLVDESELSEGINKEIQTQIKTINKFPLLDHIFHFRSKH